MKKHLFRLVGMIGTVWLLAGCGGSTPEGIPYIVSYSMPASGESVRPVLTITFNKDLDEKKNSAANFTLEDELNASVAFSCEISGSRAKITPSANLSYGTAYRLGVSGIVDLTGTAQASRVVIPFTTTEFVKSVTPEANATEVGVYKDVVITFGEVINPASLSVTISGLTFATTTTDNQTFTLTPNGGANYNGTYSGMAFGTAYSVSIDATDQYGTVIPATYNSAFSTVTPDAVAPAIIEMYPADGGSDVPADSNITLVFDEDLIPPAGGDFTFQDAIPAAFPFTATYDQTTRTVTIEPTGDLEYAQTYTLGITNVQDIFGNLLTGSITFTTSTIVKSLYPAAGDTDVAVDSTVIVLFDGSIDSSGATFTLGGVAGSVTYTASMAIFTPSADLDYGTMYAATLSGMKDAAGNTMADQIWSFSTVADTTKPVLITRSPASGAVGVSTAATVSATYDEPIQSMGTVTLQDGNGKEVAGSIGFASDTITLTPSAALKNSETYSVVVSGVQDMSGNRAKTSTWVFTTLP